MRNSLAIVLAVGLSGCGNAEPRPVALKLIPRGSCFPPTSYNISCATSLVVQLKTPTADRRSQCTVLNGFSRLQDFISDKATKFVLEDVRTRPHARIEVRAYHSVGDVAPCEELSAERLVFWGSSTEVDLSDATVDEIVVPVECRPDCDCGNIGQINQCPQEMPAGVCGPPNLYTLRERTCETDDDCFGGTLTCVDATVCQAWAPDAIGAECTTDQSCASGVCVHHTASDGAHSVDELYCAEPCPPLGDDVAACPSGMSCKRLGSGVFSRVGAGS